MLFTFNYSQIINITYSRIINIPPNKNFIGGNGWSSISEGKTKNRK